jgi:2',3'-cyclic-nucleotide 2'-phosphodiesterase (5'-nucleotidase family)
MVAATGSYNLTILHTGDVRGHVVGETIAAVDCSLDDITTSSCWGGLARLATYVNNVRSSRNNTVGDFIDDLSIG